MIKLKSQFAIFIFSTLLFSVKIQGQIISEKDTTGYHDIIQDVFKAFKNEDKKYLKDHILDKEAMTEILEVIAAKYPDASKENLRPEMVDKIVTELENKLHENFHEEMADFARYGFDLKKSKWIDPSIELDKEPIMWLYNIQFKMVDEKDTVVVKLKSCMHFKKKDWFLTEGIKVKRYQAPAPPHAVEEYMITEPYLDREYQMGEDLPPPPVVETPYDIEMDIETVAEPLAMDESLSDTTVIYSYVQQSPVYLGKDIRLEIAQKIQYPNYEKEMGIQGTVYAQFVIERNGSTSEFKILRSVPGSKNLDQEALRVLKNLDFKFEAGRNDGKVVRTYFNVPIKFVLQ